MAINRAGSIVGKIEKCRSAKIGRRQSQLASFHLMREAGASADFNRTVCL